MNKYCSKCGAELVDGVCPACSEAPSEEAKEPTPDIIEETKEENVPETTAQPEQATPNPAENEQPQAEAEAAATWEAPTPAENIPQASQYIPAAEIPAAPQAENQTVQPSKFYYVFKQFGRVIKYFFSKHTVDAIAAQYNEKLPIWVILWPVCALISALSMTLSFDGSQGLSIGAGSLFSGMKLSGLEVFLISFAMSLAVEFVYSIAVMVFLRSFKIKAGFKAAANLTMSAYIAVAVLDMVNITTIGYLNSESMAISGFGMIAFILLLYFGITKVLGDKKPFWSFFLTMACASLVAMIAALVVCCPIIVMRGLEELAKSVKPLT